jgi:dephospho-CoA kinase
MTLDGMTSKLSEAKSTVIGIVGGVASGKSEVTRYLHSKGAQIIVADSIGHEVLKRPEVASQLAAIFGNSILNEVGHIERSRLARLVFGLTPAAVENRKRLEAIVHPRIRQLIHERLATIRAAGHGRWIVLDIPLLLESQWGSMCDRILFVDTPEELRRNRALERGWTSEQFRDREASQMSIAEKRMKATDWISNACSREQLHEQLDAFLAGGLESRPNG